MNRSKPLHFLESSSISDSHVWLWGIPYDGTTSFKPGTRFGPNAIRTASDGIESYSPYLGRDLKDISFYDCGDLEVSFSSVEKVLDEIYAFAARLFNEKRRSSAIGGEHTITFPIVRAALEHYPDLHVVHIDAHCDMREEYAGERYSHASVMRRVLEVIEPDRFFGFGMRSGTEEGFRFMKKLPHYYPFSLDKMDELGDNIDSGTPLYITIDLDVLDPAFFPGTGAPEPCGISVKDLHRALLTLEGLNIVGFDVVELSPPYDSAGISSSAASFIVREMLLIMGNL